MASPKAQRAETLATRGRTFRYKSSWNLEGFKLLWVLARTTPGLLVSKLGLPEHKTLQLYMPLWHFHKHCGSLYIDTLSGDYSCSGGIFGTRDPGVPASQISCPSIIIFQSDQLWDFEVPFRGAVVHNRNKFISLYAYNKTQQTYLGDICQCAEPGPLLCLFN